MKKQLILSTLLFSSLYFAQIGIGTNHPDSSAALHLASTNKGFLPTRLVLSSSTDATTIPLPANGLIVYHTADTIYGKGLYINNGTSTAPIWSLLLVLNENKGSSIAKMNYSGAPDPTKTISAGNLEIRQIVEGGYLRFQMRRTNAPSTNVTYNINRFSWFSDNTNSNATLSVTFTPANWNVWQNYTSPAYTNSSIETYGYLIYISSTIDHIFYESKHSMRYGGTAPDTSQQFFSSVLIAS